LAGTLPYLPEAFPAMTVLTGWVNRAASGIQKGRGLAGYAGHQQPFSGNGLVARVVSGPGNF
jgi:hypothetical protein